MEKKIQTGLRVPKELNCKITEMAKKSYISKNDYILIAIAEKIKRDDQKN